MTTATAEKPLTTSSPESPSAQADLWDNRYSREGHIWGDEPSPTAEVLLEKLSEAKIRSASILEIGFGYGRDTKEFCMAGHRISAFDVSEVGLREAKNSLPAHFAAGNVLFTCGDFSKAILPEGDFDALYSHRTLHLLGNNGLVRAFARSAAKAVVPESGLLVVSARDIRDFDKSQMEMVDNDTAIYKPEIEGRRGQLISFWNEKRFETVFSPKFDIISLTPSEEMEAVNNPNKTAKFTIMVARRKPLEPS